MKKNKGGSIINITSLNAELAFPKNPAYAASKGGVRILTKALALDYAPKKIRVNNIVPGYIRTAMTEKSYSDKALNHERIDRMMIQRWGKTEDLIGAAIYLASDASSYVTGTDLIVDGGWTAKGL
jgi:NAD(P)-dependent dehydrogenase (short-subunit alcohol dehydrogenase family)